jgi:hypothetical protein
MCVLRIMWASVIAWAGYGLTAATAAGDRLGVEVGPGEVAVSAADLKLTVSREDATIQLRVGDIPCTLTPSLLLGAGWTQPGEADGEPRIARGPGEITVEIAYPVPQEQRFALEIRAVQEPPCLVVTSRLTSLTRTRAEYYYWQTTVNPRMYARPAASGPETVAFKASESETIDWHEWIWFPFSRSGLVVLPTNCSGRSSGDSGCVFLQALPRSNVIAPGESLDARFGLAAAADAVAAKALAERISKAGLVPQPMPESRDPRTTQSSTQTTSSWTTSPRTPAWLRDAEVYNLFYHPAAQWTENTVSERLRGFPFIIGSTPDRTALERCHKNDIKLLHYVVYTCLLDTDLQLAAGRPVYSEWTESIDHESRDLKHHPDWVCIRADGSPQADAWGRANGHPGLLNTCLHQPGLQEAAMRQVRMLMEAGYEGVFIDLAGPVEECYGPKAGKHSHADGRATNTDAYNDLLGRIYRLVKSYGNDRIVIQNTCTFMSSTRWAVADAQMLEAFPFGSESTSMLPTWPELQWAGAVHARTAARQGGSPVILSYFNKFTAANVREPALFSLAYARLYGFLWADGFTLARIPGNERFARSLYAVRLGDPTGEIKTSDAISYRRFKGGIALLNPSTQAVAVRIPAGDLTGALTDVGYDRPLQVENGMIRVEIGAKSGRILLRELGGRPPLGR